MGNYDISWSGDASTVSGLDRSRGQVYMAPISPWFFTVRYSSPDLELQADRAISFRDSQHYGPNSWRKNWIYRGDYWMFNTRWEQIMGARSGVDLVQIITWNDYGESHYIGPIEKDQPYSNAWVDGFDHTGESLGTRVRRGSCSLEPILAFRYSLVNHVGILHSSVQDRCLSYHNPRQDFHVGQASRKVGRCARSRRRQTG